MDLNKERERLQQIRQQLQQAQTQVQVLQNTMQQLLVEQYTVLGRIEALESKDNGDGKSGKT